LGECSEPYPYILNYSSNKLDYAPINYGNYGDNNLGSICVGTNGMAGVDVPFSNDLDGNGFNPYFAYINNQTTLPPTHPVELYSRNLFVRLKASDIGFHYTYPNPTTFTTTPPSSNLDDLLSNPPAGVENGKNGNTDLPGE